MRVAQVEDACLPSGGSNPYDGVTYVVRLGKAFFQQVPALLPSTAHVPPSGRAVPAPGALHLPGDGRAARVQGRSATEWKKHDVRVKPRFLHDIHQNARELRLHLAHAGRHSLDSTAEPDAGRWRGTPGGASARREPSPHVCPGAPERVPSAVAPRFTLLLVGNLEHVLLRTPPGSQSFVELDDKASSGGARPNPTPRATCIRDMSQTRRGTNSRRRWHSSLGGFPCEALLF